MRRFLICLLRDHFRLSFYGNEMMITGSYSNKTEKNDVFPLRPASRRAYPFRCSNGKWGYIFGHDVWVTWSEEKCLL